MVDKARETVNRQVRLLARLLDDLLEVSRITRGTVELRKQPVNITTSLANALDATRSFIDAREHSLTVSVPEQPLVLDADPMRIEQIITNLVLNAAKYTPPKGIVVVSASRQHDEAVIRVRITASAFRGICSPCIRYVHSGRPVACTFRWRIGRRPDDREEAGRAARRHDWRGERGAGTGKRVHCRLPIRPHVPELAVVKSPAVSKVTPERAHILVVEDNPDSREMLKALLEAAGHQVRIASDGPGAVEAARLHRPDLALIDIGLPGFDGYEVARRIRRHLGPGVRLIAVTGYGQEEDQRLTAAAGFDLHLVKPVSPEQLDQAIAGVGREAAAVTGRTSRREESSGPGRTYSPIRCAQSKVGECASHLLEFREALSLHRSMIVMCLRTRSNPEEWAICSACKRPVRVQEGATRVHGNVPIVGHGRCLMSRESKWAKSDRV
jgi:CheY-like chemotaxis protein